MIHPPPASFMAVSVAYPSLDDRRIPVSIRALIWVLAAFAIAGLHVGTFLTLTRADVAEPASRINTPTAVMLDLAPVPAPAKPEVDKPTDEPPTPPEEEMGAPPPEPLLTAPQLPDVAPQAVLPATPKPEMRKPERPPERRPKEKPPKQADPVRKPKPRDETKVPVRDSGGPKSSTQSASRQAAAMSGETVSAGEQASWQREVRSRIVRAKRFPAEAHGSTGVAVVRVTITASGGASGIRLVASSGNPAFDAEAVAVMSRASPYPPPPDGRPSTLTVPLSFHR